MKQPDERLDIGALGAEVVLRPSGGDCGPGEFQFDVIGTPRGFITQSHAHTDQQERYEVISGAMRLKLGGQTTLLEAGDRMATPAGAAHRQLPAGDGPGHVRVTMSPAGTTEDFLRRLEEMSRRGQINRFGMPRPVAGARLIRDFEEAGHATVPPVAVQRALSRSLLAVAEPLRRVRERLWREYSFVDEWDVDGTAEAVFDALADGRTYPRWWRPVYIDVESQDAPAVGAVARQHFKGRLPYHLHTTSRITRLETPSVIEVEVEGDLRGHGRWTVTHRDGGGVHVRFDWTVHADRRLLQVLTPLLRPALRANHNWAIARAMEGLEPYVRSQAPEPVAVAG